MDSTDTQDSYIIYKAGEQQWYGVDCQLSGVQIDNNLYEIAKNFLRDYFNQEAVDDQYADDAFVDLIDDEVMAIPGGRYGCTQYLKLCGPPEIKNLSVGRIMQMVQ